MMFHITNRVMAENGWMCEVLHSKSVRQKEERHVEAEPLPMHHAEAAGLLQACEQRPQEGTDSLWAI